jgi:hypothetical protein
MREEQLKMGWPRATSMHARLERSMSTHSPLILQSGLGFTLALLDCRCPLSPVSVLANPDR